MLALIFLAGLAAALYLSWGRPREPEPQPFDSLAVLPLDNLSGDAEQEYFTDGMTEALIANLSRIDSLRVISRTSVMRYRDSTKSLPEIARAPGKAGGLRGLPEGAVFLGIVGTSNP